MWARERLGFAPKAAVGTERSTRRSPPPGPPTDLLASTDLADHARFLRDLPTDVGPATSEITKNITREHQNFCDSTTPLSRIQTTLFHSVLMIKASGHVF